MEAMPVEWSMRLNFESIGSENFSRSARSGRFSCRNARDQTTAYFREILSLARSPLASIVLDVGGNQLDNENE
jgi:hypothetical protein